MKKVTIGGTFSVNTVEDGAQGLPAPSYQVQEYAWSAYKSGNQPTDWGTITWSVNIPQNNDPTKPYLWMRTKVMTWVDDAYVASAYTYARISGENGTGVAIKGYITVADLDAAGYDEDSIFEYLANEISSPSIGDGYIYEYDGHLYLYSGNGWIDAGQIQGNDGTSQYIHIAWAHQIDPTLGYPTAGMGFTTTKSAAETYEYMGVCVNTDAGADPQTPQSYTWNGVGGSSVVMALSNDTDVMIYDSYGNKITTSVYTDAAVYENGEMVYENVQFDVASSDNVSYRLTDEQLTVSAIGGNGESGYVALRATYKGNIYVKTFTVKKVIDGDRYEVIATPNAITYNHSKNSFSATSVSFNIYHTSATEKRHKITDLPVTASLEVKYAIGNTFSSPITVSHASGSDVWRFDIPNVNHYDIKYYYIDLYMLVNGTRTSLDYQTIQVAVVSDAELNFIAICSPSVVLIDCDADSKVIASGYTEVQVSGLLNGQAGEIDSIYDEDTTGSGFGFTQSSYDAFRITYTAGNTIVNGHVDMTADDGIRQYRFSVPVVANKRGIQGDDGLNAVTLDLSNEHDTIQYATDKAGTVRQITSSVSTTARLFEGNVEKTSNVTFSVVASGCTANMSVSPANTCIVTGVSGDKGTATISCTYNGVTYSKVFTIDKVVDEDKYELEIEPTAVVVNESGGAVTPDLKIKIYKIGVNNGTLTRTQVTSLYSQTHEMLLRLAIITDEGNTFVAPENLTPTADNDGWYFENNVWGFQTLPSDGGWKISLANSTGSVLLDWETIPLATVENGENGASVQVQYAPVSNPTSSQIHSTFQTGDKYMRMRSGNAAWSLWYLIVGENGANGLDGEYTSFEFAISAILTTASATQKPYDISDSDWNDIPIAPTTAKPYLWARVIPFTNVNGTLTPGTVTYIRLTGEKGANMIRLDLDNEYDSILYDSTGTKLSRDVTTRARLYDGGNLVDVSQVSSWYASSLGITYTTTALSGYDKGYLYTITGVTSSAGLLTVTVVYKGATYTATCSIDKIYGNEKFQLILSPNAVTRHTDRGTQSNSSINVSVLHTYVNSSGNLVESTVTGNTALTNLGLCVSINGTLASVANDGATSLNDPGMQQSSYVVRLHKGSTAAAQAVDIETVAVAEVLDGEGALVADLSNEMDSVALTYDGKVASLTTLTTDVSIFFGTEAQEITSQPTIVIDGIASSGYNTPTTNWAAHSTSCTISIPIKKDATLTNDRATATISVQTTLGTKNVVFSIAGVRAGAGGESPTIYQLQPSASVIKLNNDGSYSPATMTCSQRWVQGDESGTSNKTIQYQIDDTGSFNSYRSLTLATEKPTKNITYRLMDGSDVLDIETIPVVENGSALSTTITPSSVFFKADSNGRAQSGTTLSVQSKAVTVQAYVNGEEQNVFIDQWTSKPNNISVTYNQSIYNSCTISVFNNATSFEGNVVLECSYYIGQEVNWFDDEDETHWVDFVVSVPIVMVQKGSNGANGAGVNIQYTPDPDATPIVIHNDTFHDGDKYMRMKYTDETNWGAWFLIVGEDGIDGAHTDFSFGISAQLYTASATTAPTVYNNTWYDAPIATTDDYPYLWAKVQRIDGNGNQVGNTTYIRLTGEASIRLDLDNEYDTMLFDSADVLRSDNVITHARLYDGGTLVSPTDITWSQVANGVTISTPTNDTTNNYRTYTITGLTANSGTLTVNATYNGETYSAICSVDKVFNGEKYALIVTPASVTRNTSENNAQNVNSLYVEVVRTWLENGALRNTYYAQESVALPTGIGIRLNGGTITQNIGDVPIQNLPTINEYVVELVRYTGSLATKVLDKETIPISLIQNGLDGLGSMTLDLSNEMDAFPLDNYGLLPNSITFSTFATMYYGSEAQTLTYLSAVSRPSQLYIHLVNGYPNLSTGEIRFEVWHMSQPFVNDRIEVDITAKCSMNGVVYTQTATMTLIGVRAGADATICQLQPSATTIKKLSSGYSPTTITCDKIVTIGDYTDYDTDENVVIRWAKDNGGTENNYTGAITLNNTGVKPTRNIIFRLYDTSQTPETLLDVETIPVLEDGATGAAAVSHEIEIVSSEAKVDAQGVMRGNVQWKVQKITGSTIGYVSTTTASYTHQFKLNTASDWTTAGKIAPQTFTTNDAFDGVQGSPSSLEIRCLLNGSVVASQVVPFTIEGRMGRTYYYDGEYDSTKPYTLTPYEAPYVSYQQTIDNVTQTVYFVRIGEDGTIVNKDPSVAANSEYWALMNSEFKYIITEAMLTNFAKLGSAIFNQDFMFSQNGVMRGFDMVDTPINDSSQYQYAVPDDMEGLNVGSEGYISSDGNVNTKLTTSWVNKNPMNEDHIQVGRWCSWQITINDLTVATYTEMNVQMQVKRGNTVVALESFTISKENHESASVYDYFTLNFYCDVKAVYQLNVRLQSIPNEYEDLDDVIYKQTLLAYCRFVPSLYMNLVSGESVANNIKAKGMLYAQSVYNEIVTSNSNNDTLPVGDASIVTLGSLFRNNGGQAKVVLPTPSTSNGRTIELYSESLGDWYITWQGASSTSAFLNSIGQTGHRVSDSMLGTCYVKLLCTNNQWRFLAWYSVDTSAVIKNIRKN